MNYPRIFALLCGLLASYPSSIDAEEPERTSWILSDAAGRHSINVQLHYIHSHSHMWPELWFDTKYSDVPLSTDTRLSIVVFRGNEEIVKENASDYNKLITGRVLVWKNVDNSLLPDTIEYRAELQVNSVRFTLPNSMAEHFLVKVDSAWGFDRIEPPIVIEDSSSSIPVPLRRWMKEFHLDLPDTPGAIPIPPMDDSVRVIPIPLWDGKREIIPIPRYAPQQPPNSRRFIVPEREYFKKRERKRAK